MQLTRPMQGQELICTESFAFFEKGKKYYCMYESDSHFYIWCNHRIFGVNEIKLSKENKKFFTIS